MKNRISLLLNIVNDILYIALGDTLKIVYKVNTELKIIHI